MKRPGSLFYNVIIFVFAQLVWFLLLGLWIYWYVTNYVLLNQANVPGTPQTTNIIALVSGLILLVMLSLSLSFIFIYANRQLNLNRLYDTFIANVTHELKSPLSSIQLYLETMQKRSLSRERSTEFIGQMLNDIERLNHLINSILYLSALEQRKLARKIAHDYHIYKADEVIREVLQETIEQFKLPANTITITGSAPCECVADRFWLKIVFDNLVDNAVKYSTGSAKINVELKCTNKRVQIHFSDNGIGISQKDQKKIFQKFHRVYNPESPNVKGTGLGLYWVRQIVEYHGGNISVVSPGINAGTSFHIALPIYRESKNLYINRLLKISRTFKKEENSANV